MLAVEIDGESHRNKDVYDTRRQAWLEGQGITVLRFHDVRVRDRPQDVLRAIEGWIEEQEAVG